MTDTDWTLFGEMAPSLTEPSDSVTAAQDITGRELEAVAPADRHNGSTTADRDGSPLQRPLIALEGGPKDRQWYWLTDWHRQCQVARAQGLESGDPGATALHYRPTGRQVVNSNPRYGLGQVWRYTPPWPVPQPIPEGLCTPTDGRPVVCPKCHRPAPRLIVIQFADQDPRIDCPHCAYPDQLYMASRVSTMPAADQAWYAAREAGTSAIEPPLPPGRTEPPGGPPRILITGSRTWTRIALIRDVLTAAARRFPGAVLVHGNAHGADQISADIWRGWGRPVEPHPVTAAQWRASRDAGLARNRHMVGLGAIACLAFIRERSRGATHCAEVAEAAGIPTYRYRQEATRP